MLDYSLKIGLVPERRDIADAKTRNGIFGAKFAIENKDKALKYIKENFTDEKTSFVDLEWLNEEGLLYKTTDCIKVKECFEKEKVDAIFIINCNFGNEEAAGTIAKMMNLPVLLWGPRDMQFGEDGMRYTDSQCGLFAISKQLQSYHIPFSYIENCKIEDEIFSKELKRFLSVATMIKNFRNMKITQVGTRLNPFKSVMSNELELIEKFGFNIQTVNMTVAEDKLERLYKEKNEQLEKDAEEIKKKYDVAGTGNEMLKKMLTFVYFYIEIFEETGADVLTTECWTAMPQAFGANPCLAMSILGDMGYIVTCESDIHGAVSNVLLMSATRGKTTPLFGEFTCRNPKNKNSELLWHCGPFPYSQKKEDADAKLYNTKPCFEAKDGEYTIGRFQGGEGKYMLLGGKFNTTDGPDTFGTYLWAEFSNLSKVEKKLINGPYIHHMTEIYGDYAKELEEFCKYIPGLEYDPIEE